MFEINGTQKIRMNNGAMKFTFLKVKAGNRSGIMLVIVLWLVVILTALAVGLGRRTGIDIYLAKYTIGKLKANAAAWGGLMYAIHQINKDTQDANTNTFDSSYQCGISLESGKTPEDILKHVALGEGYFDISYSLRDSETSMKKTIYGLTDEESKININAINGSNYKVLSNLVVLLGFDENTALQIAASVVDWHDEDNAPTDEPNGAEDENYMALAKPYHCKNMPFDSLEELLLVKGMTPEIFSKIKNDLTIFPQDAPMLSINLNTAPEIVIRALGRSVTGSMTNTEIADADSLAQKVVSYRRGGDNREATGDDRIVDMNELALNAREQIIFLSTQNQTAGISSYLRVKVRGTDSVSLMHSDIEAVVARDDLSIVYWHRH